MGSVTIKDIAKRAGVSHQTVSKILHNRPSFVGEDTKQRVQNIVRELNYKPNFFARQLKGARTNTIGLLGSKSRFHFSSYTFSKVAEGAELALEDDGNEYSLLIFASSFQDTYERSLAMIENGLVDGLIIIILSHQLNDFTEKLLPRLRQANVPFVVVHSMSRELPFNNVGIDSYGSGYLAASRFAELGYESAGYYKWWRESHHHCVESEKGFLQGCENKGITDVRLFADGRSTFQGAYEYFMDVKDLPRALYFRPDAAAYGAIKAFKQRGIRVPDDVAVIGNNDENPAEYFETDLTTVCHPFADKGAAAVRMLSRLMSGELNRDEIHQETLPVEIVTRKSCGKSMS